MHWVEIFHWVEIGFLLNLHPGFRIWPIRCRYSIRNTDKAMSFFFQLFVVYTLFLFIHRCLLLLSRRRWGRWMWWRYGHTLTRQHNVWNVSKMARESSCKKNYHARPNNMTDKFGQWCLLVILKVSNCLICLTNWLCEIAGWQSSRK